MSEDQDLYKMVFKVSEVFYEKLYKDPWLKDIFKIINQEIITSQQTDFMVGTLGGPRKYCGRSPSDAHPHIYVDEEMWALREKYLLEALEETGFPKDLAGKWLRIDQAFKAQILKTSVNDCTKRYSGDEIVFVPNPVSKKAA